MYAMLYALCPYNHTNMEHLPKPHQYGTSVYHTNMERQSATATWNIILTHKKAIIFYLHIAFHNSLITITIFDNLFFNYKQKPWNSFKSIKLKLKRNVNLSLK